MAMPLVVLLVICLLLLTATLGHLYALRRRLVTRIGVFRCKVRVARGSIPQLSRHWPLRGCRAEWKHDVLIVHCGWAMTSAYPIAVRFAEDVIEPAQPTARVGMGPGAVMLRLRLDDDTVIAVASPARAWEKLAGPFLAIAAQGLSPDISHRRSS